MLDFCSFSVTSSNPKTVFHAAVVAFNHVLCYKRDLKHLTPQLMNLQMQIIEILAGAFKNKGLSDVEAVTALLLCETRMLYKNNELTMKVQAEIEDKILKVHSDLKARAPNQSVKDGIDDVLMLLG